MAVCAANGCINEFEPNVRGRPRLYCDGCSTKAAYNRRWRLSETHPRPPKPYVRLLRREAVCDRCGRTYTKTAATQRYCGDPCGEFVGAECAGCGRPFDARARDRARGGGRFCCKSHALQARNSPAVAA